VADVAHCEAIDAEDRGYGTSKAACHAANVIDWRLATTPPTTLAGIAAVLRFANEIEDAGLEWPDTDTIGRDGWHYQLRATMAMAIEAIIRADAGIPQGGEAMKHKRKGGPPAAPVASHRASSRRGGSDPPVRELPGDRQSAGGCFQHA
jgi:hypothetical protein